MNDDAMLSRGACHLDCRLCIRLLSNGEMIAWVRGPFTTGCEGQNVFRVGLWLVGPSSHSGCASHDILPTGTSAPPNVARPSAGLSRRTPSRQGEALTPRLSHDYALDQSGNYQPRRRVLPAWGHGFATWCLVTQLTRRSSLSG